MVNTIEDWQYLVFLNKDKYETDSSNRPIVYFDGKSKVLNTLNFQFKTKQVLTYQQVLDKLKPTVGIEKIAGQFKVEE